MLEAQNPLGFISLLRHKGGGGGGRKKKNIFL